MLSDVDSQSLCYAHHLLLIDVLRLNKPLSPKHLYHLDPTF